MTTGSNRHVSPSQINTFARCPRKWAYSRTAERTETAATKFGTKVHTILEDWLLARKLPSPNTPEGRCALAGLEHLPMPKTDGLTIEAELLLHYDNVKYVGRIDFALVTPTGITIGDHKTTKDLSYAKTEDDLLEDSQRIIYSYWAAQTYGAQEVNAKWVYYQRHPPVSHTVEFSESSSRIAERFEDLHKRFSLPIIQADPERPTSVERNLGACGDFGRCPYIDQCYKDDPLPKTNPLDFL